MERSQSRQRECLTLSVPEAGRRYWGLGRNASYALAKERPDLLPTTRVRGKDRVSVPVMDRIIQTAGKPVTAEPRSGAAEPGPVTAAQPKRGGRAPAPHRITTQPA